MALGTAMERALDYWCFTCHNRKADTALSGIDGYFNLNLSRPLEQERGKAFCLCTYALIC